MNNLTRAAVVGHCLIGKHVAHAIAIQPDMALAGVADVANDWRALAAADRKIALYAADAPANQGMRAAGSRPSESFEDLLKIRDLAFDCTPKRIGARNAERCRAAGKPFVLHGAKTRGVRGHSVVAESNHAAAVGRNATRVASCRARRHRTCARSVPSSAPACCGARPTLGKVAWAGS